jgi:hypothetical protein
MIMERSRLIRALLVLAVGLITIQSFMIAKYQQNEKRFHLPQMVKIGERAHEAGLALTVSSVRTDDVGAPPFSPREGYRFVVADVTIENLATSSIDISPLLDFHVKDSEGNVYNVAVVPSEKEMLSGTLLPGDSLREEIGFEIKNNKHGLRLYYESGRMSDQIVVVDLLQ